MGKSRSPHDPNSVKCQCGFCGVDGTSGVYFIPKRKGQIYFNKQHYIKHQYNGRMPFKKICACGCKKTFYTIDPNKIYIKGHQKKFNCSLCSVELEKYLDVIKFKRMNKEEFPFCINCWNNIS